MLAQNFKTPADLGVSDAEFEALVKVLGMLERGEIAEEDFWMGKFWAGECRTMGCIAGWAYYVSHGAAFPEVATRADGYCAYAAGPIEEAFMRGHRSASLLSLFAVQSSPGKVDRAAAAIAVRNYLTLGEPRWDEALAE